MSSDEMHERITRLEEVYEAATKLSLRFRKGQGDWIEVAMQDYERLGDACRRATG
jgi:hypothetical protein